MRYAEAFSTLQLLLRGLYSMESSRFHVLRENGHVPMYSRGLVCHLLLWLPVQHYLRAGQPPMPWLTRPLRSRSAGRCLCPQLTIPTFVALMVYLRASDRYWTMCLKRQFQSACIVGDIGQSCVLEIRCGYPERNTRPAAAHGHLELSSPCSYKQPDTGYLCRITYC